MVGAQDQWQTHGSPCERYKRRADSGLVSAAAHFRSSQFFRAQAFTATNSASVVNGPEVKVKPGDDSIFILAY